MIYYAIGIGGHYSDWGDFLNAYDGLSFPDDMHIEQISDIENVTEVTLASGGIVGNSKKITIVNPNNYITYTNKVGAAQCRFFFQISGAFILSIDKLHIINRTVDSGQYLLYFNPTGTLATADTRRIYVSNTRIDGGDKNCGGVYLDNDGLFYIRNCKIHDCGSIGVYIIGNLSGIASWITRYLENVTIYQCGDTILGATNSGIRFNNGNILWRLCASLKNVVSCHTNVPMKTFVDWSYDVATILNLTIDNCADSDNTINDAYGSSNVHDIIPVNEFESINNTNSAYLYLQKGSLLVNAVSNPNYGTAPLRTEFKGNINYWWPANMLLYNAGIIPALSKYDIAGLQYGKYGDYPIGCHNAEVTY